MDEPQEYQAPSWVIAVEIVLALLALCAAAVDGLVIYAVFHYKKLRTAPNVLVANWAIADIFVVLGQRCNYRIVELLRSADLSKAAVAVIEDSEWVFHSTTLAFAMLAAIDWCLASYFEGASRRYRRLLRWVVGAVWLAAVVFVCVFAVLALHQHYGQSLLLFFFAYLGSFLCVLVFSVVKMVKKCRKRASDHPTYMLTIVTVVVALWVPIWAAAVIGDLISKYAWWLVEVCYLSTSVATFAGMFRANQDFQACIAQTVRCSSNKYSDDLANCAEYHENRDDEDALAVIQMSSAVSTVF